MYKVGEIVATAILNEGEKLAVDYMDSKTKSLKRKINDAISDATKKSKTGNGHNRRKGAAFKSGRKLKRAVRTLEKKADVLSLTNNIATHTYRVRKVYQQLAAINEMKQVKYDTNTASAYETAMGALRYFDPSNPATPISADGAAGTYSRDYFFSSVTMSLTVMNNFKSTVKVRIYCCRPKTDTDIDPRSAYANGFSDQVVGGSITDPLMYLTDIDQFHKLWAIESSVSRTLAAGQHATLSCHEQKIKYNPAVRDQHTAVYRPALKNRTYMVRIEGGPVAHGSSTTTNVGFPQTGVDIVVHEKYVIRYDAGVELNDFSYSDNAAVAHLHGVKTIPNNTQYQSTGP